MNIFDNSKSNNEQIQNVHIPVDKRKRFQSKSFICTFLTKLCTANCKNCFFSSNTCRLGLLDEEYEFSQFGVDKLIEFINSSNNSYLML